MRVAGCMTEWGVRPRGIVHVGAHAAQEMDEYLALQPDLIVWIEADPATFEGLRSIVEAAPVTRVRQIALNALVADRDGVRHDFHRFSNAGASSSVFTATPLLNETWPEVAATGEVVQLESRRLDGLLTGVGLRPEDVDVLVFDIQGAELLALRGAGPFLNAARIVEVEVSQESIYEGAPLAGEVDAFLTTIGFDRATDLPWHGDAVYRRRG